MLEDKQLRVEREAHPAGGQSRDQQVCVSIFAVCDKDTCLAKKENNGVVVAAK